MGHRGRLKSSVPGGSSGPGRCCNCWRRGAVWSRPGDRVRVELLVDIDEDARIGGAVGSRNANTSWRSAAPTSDIDLVAGHVELGTAYAAGDVKSDDLGAEEVLSRGDGRWDGDSVVATVVVENLRSPIVRVV